MKTMTPEERLESVRKNCIAAMESALKDVQGGRHGPPSMAALETCGSMHKVVEQLHNIHEPPVHAGWVGQRGGMVRAGECPP